MLQVRLEEVDRSIFETIRLYLVEKGWYPDVTQYSNATDLEAAKTDLRNSGITLVEPFGVGSWQSKDEKTDSKVVLIRNQITKAGLASSDCYFYVKVIDSEGMYYRQYRYPESQKLITYDLRLICTTETIERNLLEMVSVCFNAGRKYMRPMLESGNFDPVRRFWLYNESQVQITAGRLIEWMCNFQAGPLWLDAPILIKDEIVPFTHTYNLDIAAGVIVTPDVDREHLFSNGKYEFYMDEQFIPIEIDGRI